MGVGGGEEGGVGAYRKKQERQEDMCSGFYSSCEVRNIHCSVCEHV